MFAYDDAIKNYVCKDNQEAKKYLHESSQIFRVDYGNKIAENKIATVSIISGQISKMIFQSC